MKESFSVSFGENALKKEEVVKEEKQEDGIENRGERRVDKLNNLIAYHANLINNQLGEDIVGTDGSIKMMDGFRRTKKGGLYKKEEIKKDLDYVRRHDLMFSDVMDLVSIEEDEEGREHLILEDNLSRQKYLKEECACNTKDDMIEYYKKQHAEDYGVLLESAIMVNFNKALGPEYCVVKSSPYDDYKNGIDYLIINRKTGVIACGFDAVNDDAKGERYRKKVNKKRREAEQDGAEIKYGLTIDNYDEEKEKGELVKTSIKNIPSFCIQLSRNDLEELLDEMDYNLGSPISNVGVEKFGKMINSIKNQNDALKSSKRINDLVREKIDAMDIAIEDMNRILQEKK